MGYNGPEIITRFVKYAGKTHGTENDGKNGRARDRFPNGKGSSLYYATDWQGRVIEIQSYGSHFPLAHLLLTPSGKRKMWLLNGDRWPRGGFGRTNEHNDIARAAAQASGTPCFIVPFSAIQSAGILPDTIKPIEIQPESWETEHHSAATLAEVPDYKRKRSVWHINGQLTEAPVNEKGVEASPDYRGNWTFYKRKLTDKGLSWVTEIVPGPAYDADSQPTREYEEIEPGADGLFHWTTERHWLGASVFRAKYRFGGQVGTGAKRRWVSGTRWATFVTAFDYDEPGPLWFMSELRRGANATTVAGAIDSLKPSSVLKAEDVGTPVIRQGDVFVIQATGITEKDLIEQGGELVEFESIAGSSWRRFSGRRGRYINDSHTATRAIRMRDGAIYVQGILRHKPADRRPDHVQRPLWDRKTWGRVEFNTQARSFDNTPRSWSRGGDVD